MDEEKEVLRVSVSFDRKFWAFLPAINMNRHSKTLEFEFLCFAVYFDFGIDFKPPPVRD